MAHHHIDGDTVPLRAKILTVSDGVVHGTREDKSGAALEELLGRAGWEVVERAVTEDGELPVADALTTLADGFHGLIVTTGGTGFGPRDLTPDGTAAVIDRQAPGLAEAMRLVNPLGRLSRAIAGTLDTALIVNTPGSSKGCIETLDAVLDVLGHAVRLLVDNYDAHPEDAGDDAHPEDAGDDAHPEDAGDDAHPHADAASESRPSGGFSVGHQAPADPARGP